MACPTQVCNGTSAPWSVSTSTSRSLLPHILRDAAEYDELDMLSPNIDSDIWLYLARVAQAGFGMWRAACRGFAGKILQDGAMVVMPSMKKDGGVDVFVALWEKHTKEFSSIAYTMD
uniref:Uncharacterized protein n=1 Tax=Leersia perrieri TaxID=77586 RepID=A0A0D9XNV2_9ORYZ